MGAGRPKKPVDYAMVSRLAHMQCTQEEIANVLDISSRTLVRDKEFCQVYKKGIESGKASLRRTLWKSAEAGNVTSMIWLSKNYLQMTDKIEQTGTSIVENRHDFSKLSEEQILRLIKHED